MKTTSRLSKKNLVDEFAKNAEKSKQNGEGGGGGDICHPGPADEQH